MYKAEWMLHPQKHFYFNEYFKIFRNLFINITKYYNIVSPIVNGCT